jgi:hypothetical protein
MVILDRKTIKSMFRRRETSVGRTLTNSVNVNTHSAINISINGNISPAAAAALGQYLRGALRSGPPRQRVRGLLMLRLLWVVDIRC